MIRRVSKYGQLAPECAEVYYLYGEALLENAIHQNRILGMEAQKNVSDLEEAQNSVLGGKVIQIADEVDSGENEEGSDFLMFRGRTGRFCP